MSAAFELSLCDSSAVSETSKDDGESFDVGVAGLDHRAVVSDALGCDADQYNATDQLGGYGLYMFAPIPIPNVHRSLQVGGSPLKRVRGR